MPITEEQMSHDELKKIAKNPRYHCGEPGCDGTLTLAWGGGVGYDCYILRCNKNLEHNLISKYDRKEAEYRQMVEKEVGKDSGALMKMDEAQMLARVELAKFPQALTGPDKKLLAIACITYGFDPIMSELTIYQGKPYVQIDGRYRKAQETGRLDGVEARPATHEEKKTWEIPDGDYFFRAEVYVKESSRPFVGWGRVFARETKVRSDHPGDAFKPIVTNPQRMAEKRAEAQALRKAFHIPLPSAEYIGSYEEEPVVDIKTGEIIEGEGTVIQEEKPKRKASKKTEAQLEPETVAEPEATGKRDETVIDADQLKYVYEQMEAHKMDLSAMSAYCLKEKGWDIRKLSELHQWQFEELQAYFEKEK